MSKRKRLVPDRWVRQEPVALSPGQEEYLEAMRGSDIVIVTSPPGAGKTYLAALFACYLLHQEKIRKIVLTRPLITCDNEQIGHLPGTLFLKTVQWVKPLLEAMSEFYTFDEIEEMERKEIIEICPLAFMRGRSFKNTVVLCEESQNISLVQGKMLLTRLDKGSKIIMMGDPDQSDIPKKKNDFDTIREKLRGVDGISIVEMGVVDIQRHPLIAEICRRLG